MPRGQARTAEQYPAKDTRARVLAGPAGSAVTIESRIAVGTSASTRDRRHARPGATAGPQATLHAGTVNPHGDLFSSPRPEAVNIAFGTLLRPKFANRKISDTIMKKKNRAFPPPPHPPGIFFFQVRWLIADEVRENAQSISILGSVRTILRIRRASPRR